jgi:hypothetical protein
VTWPNYGHTSGKDSRFDVRHCGLSSTELTAVPVAAQGGGATTVAGFDVRFVGSMVGWLAVGLGLKHVYVPVDQRRVAARRQPSFCVT